MKKNLLSYAVIPVAALALLGAGTASAHGMFGFGSTATTEQIAQAHADMFSKQAELLGVSADEVKNAWAQGKTFRELAEEKGLTQDQLRQKMQELRKTQQKTHLDALVKQGIITQAQADQRLASTQQNQNGNGNGRGRGFGRMGGFGW